MFLSRPALTGVVAVFCLGLAALGATAQVVQELNVTRLARLDQHGKYNDVWGYAAPDGRELALLGTAKGLSVVDVSDPRQPVEVAYFPGPTCIWRDIKTYGSRAYEVNDCAGGVRVFDLSDPGQPVLVNEFGLSLLGKAHNIQVDVETGTLYVCGSNAGLAIYDLGADPVSPPLVRTWNGEGLPGSIGYVHDLHVRNGLAHAALIMDGLYVILDVSDLPQLPIVSAVETPVAFAHSTWTTEDGRHVFTADEKMGQRNLAMYDISEPSTPVLAKSLWQGPGSMPHNPFVHGDVLHVAYYARGYIAFDISDPTEPVKIAQHGTKPPDSVPELFTGAWGCYPFTESGFVLVSDIQGGLLVLKLNPDCPADPAGLAVICETWPPVLPAGGQAAPELLVTGSGMSAVTEVQVDGSPLPPGAFEILDDQVLALQWPAVTASGLASVRLLTATGLSEPAWVGIVQPDGPLLASGPVQVEVGNSIQHVLRSAPHDLQWLAFSLDPTPSTSPKVSYAIGAGWTSLFLLPPLLADVTGTTTLPPFEVPASAAGLTAYWQFAALAAAPQFPVPTSNATATLLLP